jgi:uracil-DNA glycosylase
MRKDTDLGTDELRRKIAGCLVCEEFLPAGPRPIVQFSATSKILVIGQAPGARVHASGVPWQDGSGERLRDWMGIDPAVFYDPSQVALMPMGFCYPGSRAGGDLPPRPECAPLWHHQILAMLPVERLTLLVGSYAQAYYLPRATRRSMTDTVRDFEAIGPALVPLPHPAWRAALWMEKNPWFAETLLPQLRTQIRARISG